MSRRKAAAAKTVHTPKYAARRRAADATHLGARRAVRRKRRVNGSEDGSIIAAVIDCHDAITSSVDAHSGRSLW
jgi:hypothetical protein